jgi:hypothetical protein
MNDHKQKPLFLHSAMQHTYVLQRGGTGSCDYCNILSSVLAMNSYCLFQDEALNPMNAAIPVSPLVMAASDELAKVPITVVL